MAKLTIKSTSGLLFIVIRVVETSLFCVHFSQVVGQWVGFLLCCTFHMLLLAIVFSALSIAFLLVGLLCVIFVFSY